MHALYQIMIKMVDGMVNMYVGSDTEEEFQEEEPETTGRVSDLENSEVDNTNTSIDLTGQQEVCSEEDIYQRAPESTLMVLQVARRRGQADSMGIGVTTRKRTEKAIYTIRDIWVLKEQ
ncbi:hypothetical protein HOY80DRAFT_1001785 [Tuber brumale]|nr:hypothetical protein HOY80DRAFT_1001785 [Tuber brumale]